MNGPGHPASEGRAPAILLVAAAVVLLALMPAWRWMARPLPPPEGYAISAEAFSAKVDAMTARHATGEKTEDGGTVVRPPPGDVYLLASRWRFDPALELEVGRTYRLHVATADVTHGFNFPLGGADFLLVPGHAYVVTLTPAHPGDFAMQCSEYCGQSHSRMKSQVRIVPSR
ncbi:MAG: quinol oxidase [Alphaproteobacteria bacterium]|nr:quinol oxidase [Alphaproteobacteria bacterium]MBF0129827.1 quinol oxidase [Alphaproteobacteria bacterium]